MLTALLSSAAPAAAATPAWLMPQPMVSAMSLQGFTGILNTPTAHVQEGSVQALYSNQKDERWRETAAWQDNYMLSVGMFDWAEIGGRLTSTPFPPGVRDLSVNAKLSSAPLTRNMPLFPVLALGMQDFAGGATFLQTKYAVISEDIWRLRVSAGYGSGPDRMKGAFAGAEFKAHDWIYLLGEYDTRETNVGARIVTPPFWKLPISFTATAKTSLNHKPGSFDIAAGFSFPLDFNVRSEKRGAGSGEHAPTEPPASNPGPAVFPELTSAPGTPAEPERDDTSGHAKMAGLRERLIKAGFMNVRVGESEESTLVVEYENSIFNHNELDAVGVVSGLAAEALRGRFDRVRLIIRKKGIAMVQITMPLLQVAAFIEGTLDRDTLQENLEVSNSCDDSDVTFVAGDDNSSFLASSLVLWPGLSTWVGTEAGVFDYLLSLKAELFVQTWKGGVVNARWDIPLSWSSNLDEGKAFHNNLTNSRMERLMLFQGIKLLPNVMANLGAGMLMPDLYGTMNELVWQPGTGRHSVRLAQVWGHSDSTRRDMESFLGSYRYYFSPLDLFLEGTLGKFMFQDRGFSLELKRFFGDTAFSVYYKNTTIPDNLKRWDGDPKRWQAVGVQFAFPLTPGKDMKHYYKMQLRGTDEWSYAQETTSASGNSANANYVPPVPLAAAPLFTASLHNQYLNRDRLNEAYIRSHLERLREAWIRYGDRL